MDGKVESELLTTEHPAAIESARRLRQEIRDGDPLASAESERIKRLRFSVDPKCDACTLVIEKVEDADMITQAVGTNGAARNLLIHNACWMLALTKLALRANGLGRRR